MDAKKQTPQDWEDAVEKQIRAAMERGEFDNLRGKGKPLDLGGNPYAPDDWQLAYKMMKDAGVAPDWIEAGKDIRADLQTLTTWLAKQAQWQRERAAKSKTLAPDKLIAEYEHLARVREQTGAKFRERAAALNKEIDVFNLKAPPGIPHFARLRIEEEIEKFQAACIQK
jgi:hypothetical protein